MAALLARAGAGGEGEFGSAGRGRAAPKRRVVKRRAKSGRSGSVASGPRRGKGAKASGAVYRSLQRRREAREGRERQWEEEGAEEQGGGGRGRRAGARPDEEGGEEEAESARMLRQTARRAASADRAGREEREAAVSQRLGRGGDGVPGWGDVRGALERANEGRPLPFITGTHVGSTHSVIGNVQLSLARAKQGMTPGAGTRAATHSAAAPAEDASATAEDASATADATTPGAGDPSAAVTSDLSVTQRASPPRHGGGDGARPAPEAPAPAQAPVGRAPASPPSRASRGRAGPSAGAAASLAPGGPGGHRGARRKAPAEPQMGATRRSDVGDPAPSSAAASPAPVAESRESSPRRVAFSSQSSRESTPRGAAGRVEPREAASPVLERVRAVVADCRRALDHLRDGADALDAVPSPLGVGDQTHDDDGGAGSGWEAAPPGRGERGGQEGGDDGEGGWSGARGPARGRRLVAHATVRPERSMVRVVRGLEAELDALESRFASLIGGAAADVGAAAGEGRDAEALRVEAVGLADAIRAKAEQIASLKAAVRGVRGARERSPAVSAGASRARVAALRSFERVREVSGGGARGAGGRPAPVGAEGAGVAWRGRRRAGGAAGAARDVTAGLDAAARIRLAGEAEGARGRGAWMDEADDMPMWVPADDADAVLAEAHGALEPVEPAGAIVGGGAGRPAGGTFRARR